MMYRILNHDSSMRMVSLEDEAYSGGKIGQEMDVWL